MLRRPARTRGGECCVGPGVCNEFTVWVCQESASCSREGAYLNESIDDVFLGCECTEACYCARDGGGIIGEWFGGASLSACAQAAEYGGEIPGGIVDGASAKGGAARPYLVVRASAS